jgi:hypothetical protein
MTGEHFRQLAWPDADVLDDRRHGGEDRAGTTAPGGSCGSGVMIKIGFVSEQPVVLALGYGENRVGRPALGLVLKAVDVAGPWRWRWLLTDGDTGAPLADHDVALELAADQVARFADLYGQVRWRAAPDRRALDEARLVAEAGAWAGKELLGDRIGTAIAAAAPVTVLVRVPALAGAALGWPLELSHANGRPLAARGDVAFVYDLAPELMHRDKAGVSGGAAGAGGVLPADQDRRSGAAAGAVRAEPADRADRRAGSGPGGTAGGSVRCDQAAAGRDRRFRPRLGRAAPVRARRPRGVRAWSTPTGRRTR